MPKPYIHIDLFYYDEYVGTFNSETLAEYFDKTLDGIRQNVRGGHKLRKHYRLIRSDKPFSEYTIAEKMDQILINKKQKNVKVFNEKKAAISSSGRTFKLYDWN